MNPWIVFAIILLVALAILGFLYYKGSKLQKEQQEQKEQLFSAAFGLLDCHKHCIIIKPVCALTKQCKLRF